MGTWLPVQKFAEPGRRLFLRHFIELRQDENAFGKNAFLQIGFTGPPPAELMRRNSSNESVPRSHNCNH